MTPTSIYQLNNSGSFHSTYLIKVINDESDIEKIKLDQKIENDVCKIELIDENGERITMAISIAKVSDEKLFSFNIH